MTDAAPPNPVLVEVRRGGVVESRHRGAVVAVDADGKVVFGVGDTAASVYPRSAIKIFQALPLMQSAAADAFALSPEEVALACASHNGEALHVDAVRAWLRRLDLADDDLECGAEPPSSRRAADALAAAGEAPSRAHHNCSGKHAGMLTLAKFLRAPTRGYGDYDHPVNRAWMEVLTELAGVDVFSLAWERDGCGLPAVCMPLAKLARAFAAVADADADRGDAFTKIFTAVCAHPVMFAGAGRCCTDVLRHTDGVLVKVGAEGVYAGVVIKPRLGFALKIDDGAARAADAALGKVLQKLGALTAPAAAKLKPHFAPTLTNSQGHTTGNIAATEW